MDTLVTPGPDGRSHKMYSWHALRAQLLLKSQVEVGCIHAQKERWWGQFPALRHVVVDPDQTWQGSQGIYIPKYRKRCHGMPDLHAALLKCRTTDPLNHQIRYTFLHSLQQSGCNQIP